MINITEQMVEAALQAHFRNSGTAASTNGMRSALHTVSTVRLTEARRAALGCAIKALESWYGKEVSGDLIAELKLMIVEMEKAQ